MSEPSQSSSQTHPSIVFAQKVAAIVKAAGYNPHQLEVEEFRQNALDIFINAVRGIYKADIEGIIDDAQTEEEKLQNCHCLLACLSQKSSQNHTLLSAIDAKEIIDGVFKSIGIMVNVVFAEGQRLWLEKKKRESGIQDFENIKRQLRPSSAPANATSARTSTQFPPFVGDIITQAASNNKTITGAGVDAEKKGKYSLANSPQYQKNVKALVMDSLGEKIKQLEEEIDQISKADKVSSKLLKEFDDFVRGPSNTISDPTRINSLLSPRARAFSVVAGNFGQTNILPLVDPKLDEIPENSSSDDDKAEEGGLDYEEGEGGRIHKTNVGGGKRMKRPSSAPSHRSRTREQNAVFNRLFRAAQDARKAAIIAAEELATQERAAQRQRQQWFDRNNVDTEYTYDMESGRRILVSTAEKLEQERKRAKEAMGLVFQDTIHVGKVDPASKKKAISSAPLPPPVVLNPRFEQSMEEYVLKQKMEREAREAGPTRAIPVELTSARCFGAYRSLQPLDLVISVEHCHDCEKHASTTRHNPADYVNMAHTSLRWLAELVHSMRFCVRVGVIRFKAKLTATGHHVHNAPSDRIGALEIQVAFKNKSGQVLYDLLHSKLATTRWPSKSVVEKRLISFASKANIPAYAPSGEPTEYAGFASDGIAEYPVGVGPWSSTSLCDDDWTMPDRPPIEKSSQEDSSLSSSQRPIINSQKQHGDKNSKMPEKSMSKKKGDKQTATAVVESVPARQVPLFVQWVFDSRSSAAPLPIPVGSTVRVHRVHGLFKVPNRIERHPLLAVVKGPVERIHQGDDPNLVGHEEQITIRLKYHQKETIVNVSNCIPLAEYIDPVNHYQSSIVPPELQALWVLWNDIRDYCEQLPATITTGAVFVVVDGEEYDNPQTLLKDIPAPNWRVLGADDHQDSTRALLLSRASIFHHFREMVAWIQLITDSLKLSQFSLDVHPITGEQVDLQLTYSEECLSWIQGGVSTGRVNVNSLEHLIIESLCILQPCDSLIHSIFVKVANIPAPIPTIPPTYKKLSTAELTTAAANIVIFSFRWKLCFVIRTICNIRRMHKSGRNQESIVLSCLTAILRALHCDEEIESSKFTELLQLLGVIDKSTFNMSQLLWRSLNPSCKRYANVLQLFEYLVFAVTPAEVLKENPFVLFGAADLGIAWVKLTEQLLEASIDPRSNLAGARNPLAAERPALSKSLDTLPEGLALLGAGELKDSALKSSLERLPSTEPLPSVMLSIAKALLLKPEPIMLEAEYNQIAETFEIDKILTPDESQLILQSFWTVQVTISRAPSIGSSSVSSKTKDIPPAPEYTETTSKTLKKLDFLIWLLDLDPLLVFINLVSLIADEFGGNRSLATRSFIQILQNSFPSDAVLSEKDIIALFDKLTMPVHRHPLLALGIHVLFRKCGRIDDHFIAMQVFANLLHVATVDACEDHTLLTPMKSQAQDGSVGNRRMSSASNTASKVSGGGGGSGGGGPISRLASELQSGVVSAASSIGNGKSISSGDKSADVPAASVAAELALSRSPSAGDDETVGDMSARGQLNEPKKPTEVIAVTVKPIPAAPPALKLPPWRAVATRESFAEPSTSTPLPSFRLKTDRSANNTARPNAGETANIDAERDSSSKSDPLPDATAPSNVVSSEDPTMSTAKLASRPPLVAPLPLNMSISSDDDSFH